MTCSSNMGELLLKACLVVFGICGKIMLTCVDGKSHDEQCRAKFGQNSAMCRDNVKPGHSMCRQITCWNSMKSECSGLTLADNTSCDNKKWCKNKKCVYDTNAPALDKSCLFGDYGGQIKTDHGYLNCPEIASYPDYCPVDFYKKVYCCKSCKQKDTNLVKGNKVSNYTIEVFVMADYSSYQKWLNIYGQNPTVALLNMKKFYAYVIDGARRHYENLVMPGVRISCSLIGIYIARKSTDLPFVEQAKISGNRINQVETADLFNKWINNDLKSQKPILPKFDVVMLFIEYQQDGGAGYGYLNSACQTFGLSIVRDENFFFTTHTATHEIGHNLGARHDGSAGCNDDDSYLMSATKLGQNIDNLYKFTKCSISQFKRYFDTLNRGTNCLTTSEKRKPVDIKLKAFPGMEYSYDEQCRIMYGPKSAMCRDNIELGDNMCEWVSCWNPAKSACWGLTLADGTPCDNNKWCMNKRCVSDPRAPTLDESCPFGDYGGEINTDKGYLKCSEISKDPNYCKVEFYNKKYCCKSCNKRGNKHMSPPAKATRPSKATRPPKTTKSAKPTRDCQNGDRAPWCKEYVGKYGQTVCASPDLKNTCCETCK